MKKTSLFLFVFLLLANVIFSQNIPEPQTSRYVHDFAGLFTDLDAVRLDAKLKAYEQKTSIEIAVVTVKTLDGYEIEPFANKLFNKWGIGKAKVNSGLLILIAPNERKWRFEIGYGLEPYLTDGDAGAIGRKIFPPAFKKQLYYEGVDIAVNLVIASLGNSTAEVRQELLAQKKKDAELARQKFIDVLMTVIGFLIGSVCIFFLVVFLKRYRNNRILKLELIRKCESCKRQINSYMLNLENEIQNKDYTDDWDEYSKVIMTANNYYLDTTFSLKDSVSILNEKLTGFIHNSLDLENSLKKIEFGKALLKNIAELNSKVNALIIPEDEINKGINLINKDFNFTWPIPPQSIIPAAQAAIAELIKESNKIQREVENKKHIVFLKNHASEIQEKFKNFFELIDLPKTSLNKLKEAKISCQIEVNNIQRKISNVHPNRLTSRSEEEYQKSIEKFGDFQKKLKDLQPNYLVILAAFNQISKSLNNLSEKSSYHAGYSSGYTSGDTSGYLGGNSYGGGSSFSGGSFGGGMSGGAGASGSW